MLVSEGAIDKNVGTGSGYCSVADDTKPLTESILSTILRHHNIMSSYNNAWWQEDI